MEKKIFLLLRNKELTFSFTPSKTDSDKLYQELKLLGGGGQGSGVCLEDSLGNRLRITPSLPPNTPQSRYNLLVYNDHERSGMLIDDVNMDLVSLEKRLGELENQLKANCQTMPSVVEELKQDLELFRNKLETTKHLSWLSYYKDLPPTSRKLEYRRRSDAKQKLVREQFYHICEQVLGDEVRQCLRLSSFDCMQWSDEEILHLLQWMFLDFDLPRLFSIPMVTLRSFLFTVYKNYNEVPFHNFRHCFCVAQMMYAMSWKADLAKRLGSLEVLILLVSCICHDLDHPGYNNIYQINAKTELALRYNDISPLENHHCSIAFRILDLPDCNIFSSFNSEEYKLIREGIIRCILATDMARHNEILAQFKEAVATGFDYSNKAHTNLLTMVLIKVADISNEARPMEVAEPWLDRLLQEFFTQSDAEKEEGLPVTPFMDRDKITKPSSQCSFIGFVLLPLFEALCSLLTELQPMILEPVKFALDYYRRLNEATAPPSPHGPLTKSPSSITFRKTSIAFSQGGDNDSEMLDGGLSTEEEETVTEVAVSEKALKFKISTESSSSGRKSYPGSRKGSRERSHEQDLSWSLRGSDSGEKRSWEGCEACSRRQAGRSQSLVEPAGGPQSVISKSRSVSAGGSPDGIRDFHHHHHHHHCDATKSHDPPLKTIGEGCLLKETTSSPPLVPPVELVENGDGKKSSSPGGLLRRLKSLGGRLKEVPGSPASLRSVPTPKEEARRAMTLPKVRAGQRPTKRWRTILKISKHHSIALGEEGVNNNRKGEGTSRSSSPSRTSKRWVHSLVSSIRGKRSPQDPQTSQIND